MLVPRAVPGLLAGLAFLWVFLFFPPLGAAALDDLQRLARLHRRLARLRHAPGLELAAAGRPRARGGGAQRRREPRPGQPRRHLPLIRYGLLASWLLVFMIFEREYSTGVYLLGPGTEVIGSLLVSLWGTGAAESVAALSFINVVLVAIGLTVALRFGVKLHD